MSYIILDIDNTIANDGWRIPFIDWNQKHPFERYHEYHLASVHDEPGNCDLFESTQHEIVLFTARPYHYKTITENWLRKNGVRHKELYMRPNHTHCSSVELKRKMFEHFILGVRSFEEIQCAYDDREDVVELYRSLGIKAEVRRIHGFCAYTGPLERASNEQR